MNTHGVAQTGAATASGASVPEPGSIYVVGFGGTVRADSSSERMLKRALEGARAAGAETELFAARDLDLPMYDPGRTTRTADEERFVDAIARADGVMIASPGYHGAMSGKLKNALDYIEDLRDHDPPYLDSRAVGCIVCAYGWQATVTTLVGLRSVVHALRGWPTPLGVAINTAEPIFSEDGSVVSETVSTQLDILAEQVVQFARLQELHKGSR